MIGAQLYTVREHTQNEHDLERTFQRIRAIGYNAVQVSAIGPTISAASVKELADKHQLRICATHISYERLVHDLDQVIADHLLWNCNYVGIGSLPISYRGSAEGYSRFAEEASEIGRKLQQQGLRFVYHNHKFEFEKFADAQQTGLEILRDRSDSTAFGFELDLYWVQAGGADPVHWIQQVAGRMDVVHLKDMAIVADTQVTAEIGEGNMDYSSILAACRATGVSWYVVEQDDCRRDPFESLAISYRALQHYL